MDKVLFKDVSMSVLIRFIQLGIILSIWYFVLIQHWEFVPGEKLVMVLRDNNWIFLLCITVVFPL